MRKNKNRKTNIPTIAPVELASASNGSPCLSNVATCCNTSIIMPYSTANKTMYHNNLDSPSPLPFFLDIAMNPSTTTPK